MSDEPDQDIENYDLKDQMVRKVRLAASKSHAEIGGETMDFIIDSSVLPGEQGQPQAVFVLTLVLPSMLVGSFMQGTAVIPNLKASQEEVERVYVALAKGLLDARSKQARESLTMAPPATVAGSVVP
jgi:hypothetical protein